MENIEDHFVSHFNSIKTEWVSLREKWFTGEKLDPVFEGVVRDFCAFDEIMHHVHGKVNEFMKGVEQLAQGMTALSEGVSEGLLGASDRQIASDGCKLKEATNQIARLDAPHSAIAKLRRDMNFNIVNPVRNHITNNRNLKVNLEIRRKRLAELNVARQQYDEMVRRNIPRTDRRFLRAQSALESAKMTFSDMDRHVFEWLYILEEYRNDILDSTLQTLKHLEYEFFATSAHAISISLPARMEFRPMVEMTPDHLEQQVEMELQTSEEDSASAEAQVADFSTRLIDKKVREDDGSQAALPVDPLSLSSLLSQGFEEGPARRALRLHQNNTQAALDWLVSGQDEDAQKQKALEEGVRMPTTVRRVQKLKAMRKAQQEKAKAKEQPKEKEKEESDDEEDDSKEGNGSRGSSATSPSRGNGQTSSSVRGGSTSEGAGGKKESPELLDQDFLGPPERGGSTAAPGGSGNMDLLSLDDEEPAPTDFSKQVGRTALPEQRAFDTSRCEKGPLPAALASGLAAPRVAPAGSGSAGGFDLSLTGGGAGGLEGLAMPGAAPSAVPATSAPAPAMPAELMAQVQALAAQSQVTPEALLQAAQQLAAQQAATGTPAAPVFEPQPRQASAGQLPVGQWTTATPSAPAPGAAGGISAQSTADPTAPAALAEAAAAEALSPGNKPPAPAQDYFSDLMALTSATPKS